MYVDMGEKSLSRPKLGSTILPGGKKSDFLSEVTEDALGGGSAGAHFGGRH